MNKILTALIISSPLWLSACTVVSPANNPQAEYYGGSPQGSYSQQNAYGQQPANNNLYRNQSQDPRHPMMQQQSQQLQQPQLVSPQVISPMQIQTIDAVGNKKFNDLAERVRRLEKAMIRLDRRMQLMERNELSRMSAPLDNETNNPAKRGFKHMGQHGSDASEKIEKNQRFLNQPQEYTGKAMISSNEEVFRKNFPAKGFQPVSLTSSSRDFSGKVYSSLQPVQKEVEVIDANYAKVSSLSRMPSLATKKSADNADGGVSIWTVNYETSKVWPAREELSASRGVIEAIRSGQDVTLFARGSRPNSKEFRERVRAISKYLSKVSSVESMPIASMPANHLGTDTIEILATR